jgi:hypothetical protein
MSLRNVNVYLQVHTALQPSRPTPTSPPPREPAIPAQEKAGNYQSCPETRFETVNPMYRCMGLCDVLSYCTLFRSERNFSVLHLKYKVISLSHCTHTLYRGRLHWRFESDPCTYVSWGKIERHATLRSTWASYLITWAHLANPKIFGRQRKLFKLNDTWREWSSCLRTLKQLSTLTDWCKRVPWQFIYSHFTCMTFHLHLIAYWGFIYVRFSLFSYLRQFKHVLVCTGRIENTGNCMVSYDYQTQCGKLCCDMLKPRLNNDRNTIKN